jgi:hypothetical protein
LTFAARGSGTGGDEDGGAGITALAETKLDRAEPDEVVARRAAAGRAARDARDAAEIT